MGSQIYLVLIRDGRLALAVGAALEDRLLRDGHGAMAVVPTVRGPEFTASDGRRHLGAWRTGSAADRRPQVVGLYEDGLLESLATLGLPAYVGVRDGDEPRIARWADGLGAIMVPVGTARDLVDAVADHTPWSQHAAGLPPARYRAGKAAAFIALGDRQAGRDGQPPQSRRTVAAASIAAVPLLLAGLPTIAMAAGVGQAPVVRNLSRARGGARPLGVGTLRVRSA
jgi:hypothetical protein